MAHLKIVKKKENKIPRTYKFDQHTIDKLEKISKQQKSSMTTVLEYLIDNFDNLVLQEDDKKTKRNIK